MPVAGRPGAVGGRALPHESHHAAVRPAVRLLAGDGVPGDQAAAATARDLAGTASGRRGRSVVDRESTLVPVQNRTTGASSRNYRFSANAQVAIVTKPIIAAARPLPGQHHGREGLTGFRPSPRLRGRDRAGRRRVHQRQARRPTPQTPRPSPIPVRGSQDLALPRRSPGHGRQRSTPAHAFAWPRSICGNTPTAAEHTT